MGHLSRMLLIVAAAIAVFGFAEPAAASIRSADIVASPASFTGICPVNITFQSSVQGTNGTTFRYDFVRHVNGVQTVVPGGSGTISGGFFSPPNDSMSIGSSTSAALNADQLWVHNISPVQPDVYSGYATFAVTCLIGLPPRPLHLSPPAPTDVTYTNQLGVCKQHAPSDACGFILFDATNSKSLVLVWDLPASFVPSSGSIDGYKIYRVDGGRHDSVGKQPFEYVRAAEVPKPSDGSYQGKCYAVSSYNATAESGLSAPYCTSRDIVLGTPHVTLITAKSASRHRVHQRGLYYPGVGCDAVCVGYAFDSSNGTDLGDQSGVAWRGYLLFDPAAIAGLKVTKATLRLRTSGGDASCLDKASAANRAWWNNKDWIDGDFNAGVAPTAANQTGALLDVTRIVRHWANGDANFGFVLTGKNEDIGTNATISCRVDFRSSAVLDIESY